MNSYLKHIEEDLGFKLPVDLINLYTKANEDSKKTYVFDLKAIGGHWLLNGDYFLLSPDEHNNKERGEYFIKDFYVDEGENLLLKINETVSKSIREYWSENKVFAFAWSNEVLEKDASLVYVFDDFGIAKGIYIHSLNFVEDKIFVANSISELISYENSKLNSNVIKFTSFKESELSSYAEVLKGSYKIIDLESVDDVKDYQYIINILTDLSKGKFSPQIKAFHEKNSVRNIDLEINQIEYSIQLQGNTDYVDLKVIDYANKVLEDNGFRRKKFVAFKEANFGQEIGIAFVSKSKLKDLGQLKNIELVKLSSN